jgi:hypothetical protein
MANGDITNKNARTAFLVAFLVLAACLFLCTFHIEEEEIEYTDIYTESDFMNIADDPFSNYRLMNDITISGPVDTFSGELKGRGYTITVSFNADRGDVGGLFDKNDGHISDLTVNADIFVDGWNSGIVVGTNYGTIKNVTATGNITGTGNVAGIAGINYGTVTNSSNSASVSLSGADTYHAAGIVSYNHGTVKYCSNTGAIYQNPASSGSAVGGIVARMDMGTIQFCFNSGDVTGVDNIGGISGWNMGGIISNCYNEGLVTASAIEGGIAGSVGRAGEPSLIEFCYNVGQVTGSPWFDPIVAYADSGSVIIGGVYRDSVEGDFGGRHARTSASMQLEETFTSLGYDFLETWTFSPGATYPQLKNMTAEIDPAVPGVGTTSGWIIPVIVLLLGLLLVLVVYMGREGKE